MKKNKFLSVLSLLISGTLILSCTYPSASAVAAGNTGNPNTAKEENIYANLNNDGSVIGIYVVNAYNLSDDTFITDYGNYSSLRNLTSNADISSSDSKITVQASKGKFYYQGNTDSTELPWKIDISYSLNGKSVSGSELAGASGALEIQIRTSQNPGAAEEFFKNYLLQATVTLNTDKCANIRADGATPANIGRNKQLLYTIMGGQEKAFTITADVTGFEFEPVSFTGIPMSFDINLDDMDIGTLDDKTDELKDGVRKLDDGTEELLDGSEKLQDGLSQYTEGIDTLYSGTNELTDGVNHLYTGVSAYTEGAVKIAEGIDTLSDKTSNLPALMEQLSEAITQLYNGSSLLAADSTGAAAQITAALTQISGGLFQMKSGLTAMNTQGIAPMLAGMEEIKINMAQFKTALAGTSSYVTALSALSNEYAQQAETLKNIISSGSITTFSSAPQINAVPADNSGNESNFSTVSGNTVPPAAASGSSSGSAGSPAGTATSAELNALYGRMAYNSAVFAGILNGNGTPDNPGLAALASSCTSGLEKLNAALFTDLAGSISMYSALLALQEQISGDNGAIDGVQSLIDGIELLKQSVSGDTTSSLKSSLNALNNGISSLNEKTASLPDTGGQLRDGINTLKNGAGQLTGKNTELTDGCTELQNGVISLQDGASTLADKSTDILDGTQTLTDGIISLKNGTEEMQDKTSDIDIQIRDGIETELENFTGKNYEGGSFVSPKNTNVDAVQFVMKTDGITIPEAAEPEIEKNELSFWEKIKALF